MTNRWLAALMIILSLVPAAADDAASRGRKVVDEWCRLCHLRAGQPPRRGMEASYEEIVRRPGRDAAYFNRLLHEDHFPMTTFRLFEHEKQDVLAYLMWLQRRQQQRRR
ncbi:MAG: hypothetical protein FD152_1511 [Xanthobacteraceae bacterium]|nr:MAG: hypothetical protein FD152_1511 [Xanthobacteraceae bacterium]